MKLRVETARRPGNKTASISYLMLLLAGVFGMTSHNVAASYLENEDAKLFMQEMQDKYQYDADVLKVFIGSAERQDSILKAIARPAEKRLEWKDYRKLFVNEDRISKGVEFIKKYEKELLRAENEFGVNRYIVAAIIGVETRYGKNKGNYRVIDALATLAFDYPPRSKFFRGELEQFLLMLREQHFDGLELKGSYAGAMGYGQFIPSSYRNFAVDFTGDGVADLLKNPVDAIGSVANYFKQHRWERGGAVTGLAGMGDLDISAFLYGDLKPKNTVAELAEQGIHFLSDEGLDNVGSTDKARLLSLEGEAGVEYWITLNNFYVITRYNHSPLYAMAVYQLSEALRSGSTESTPAEVVKSVDTPVKEVKE